MNVGKGGGDKNLYMYMGIKRVGEGRKVDVTQRGDG